MGLNHIQGHIFSNFIHKNKINFPALSLVISGGHSHLFYMENKFKSKIICKTNDDSIGEALDKIGKFIKLEYPGAISIDKIAQKNSTKINFSIYKSKDIANFSFSGLKSQAIRLYEKNKNNEEYNKENFCFWVQNAAFEQIIYVLNPSIKKIQCKNHYVFWRS